MLRHFGARVCGRARRTGIAAPPRSIMAGMRDGLGRTLVDDMGHDDAGGADVEGV